MAILVVREDVVWVLHRGTAAAASAASEVRVRLYVAWLLLHLGPHLSLPSAAASSVAATASSPTSASLALLLLALLILHGGLVPHRLVFHRRRAIRTLHELILQRYDFLLLRGVRFSQFSDAALHRRVPGCKLCNRLVVLCVVCRLRLDRFYSVAGLLRRDRCLCA